MRLVVSLTLTNRKVLYAKATFIITPLFPNFTVCGTSDWTSYDLERRYVVPFHKEPFQLMHVFT